MTNSYINKKGEHFRNILFSPEKQAKLDLLEKVVCISEAEPGRYWVATFKNGRHVSHGGLYERPGLRLALFSTPEEAFEAALNPEKFNMQWGLPK